MKKKTSEDIIILHLHTANDNHMIYGSWDIKSNRQNVVILDHILPFYHPNNSKNQNSEKMKKRPRDIIILHLCITNDDHTPDDAPETWNATDRISHFGPFFALLPPP